MSVSEDVAGLADELQKGALGVRTEIQAFPSGVVWLDVQYAGRLFNFVYLPTEQCFGVDEFDLEEHGIGTHFRFSFEDFHPARAKLLSMLEEVVVGQDH